MTRSIIMNIVQYGILVITFPSLLIGMASEISSGKIDKYHFTDHAKMRMIERTISAEDILEAITSGRYHNISKEIRKYINNRKGICVVVGTKRKLIITAYPKKNNGPKLRILKNGNVDTKSEANVEQIKQIYGSLLQLSSADNEENKNIKKELKKMLVGIKHNNVTREEFRQARLNSLLTAKKANSLMAIIGSNVYEPCKIKKAKEKKCLHYKLSKEIEWYRNQSIQKEQNDDNDEIKLKSKQKNKKPFSLKKKKVLSKAKQQNLIKKDNSNELAVKDKDNLTWEELY